MHVFIRADSSGEIGSGHVNRCLTLAKTLREENCSVEFISRRLPGNCTALISAANFTLHEISNTFGSSLDWRVDAAETVKFLASAPSADLLIVDHYSLDSRWEACVQPYVQRLMAIDDMADRPHAVSLLLDQNLVENYMSRYLTRVPSDCGLLLGPRYALLQPEYASLCASQPPRPAFKKAERVLVYFGGADRFNLTTITVESVLKTFNDSITVDVILPPTNPQWLKLERLSSIHPNVNAFGHVNSLASILMQADFCIGGGGATTWERLCLGVPTLVITLAPNQVPIAKTLHDQQLIEWLGDAQCHSALELSDTLMVALRRINQNGVTALPSDSCQHRVDGRGTQRVVAAILLDSNSRLRARPATYDDLGLLFEWANDPVTRSNAFSPATIALETHQNWMKNKLANYPKTQIFIVETNKNVPVGQVRFECLERQWELHYSMGSAFRGKRLGAPLLKSALDAFRRKHPNATIFGRVKPENVRSCSVFRSLGFEEELDQANCLRFILQADETLA